MSDYPDARQISWQTAPPDQQWPSRIGKWASENAASRTDPELAQTIGVSPTHLSNSRRIWQQLDPSLHWLVDNDRLSLRQAVIVCRLPDHREQRLLTAGVLHEQETSQSPVSPQTLAAIVKQRREHPAGNLEHIMSEVAGIRFHSDLKTITVTEDLPQLYEASWQWKDASLADYVAQAPYRLMMLSRLIRGVTLFPMPGSPEEIRINVSLDIEPRGVIGKGDPQ